MDMVRKAAVLLFLGMTFLISAEEVQFAFRLEDEYRMTERADYSKRVNGVYQGYVNRQVQGVFRSREEEPGVFHVDGTWFRAREIRKDGLLNALPLERVEEAEFIQDSLGRTRAAGDFPLLRNFPQFPAEPVSPGDSWEAPMEMIIFDPRSDLTAELSLYCGYTYQGTDVYKERPVHVIQAQYAVRKKGYDRNIGLIIDDVQGSHRVTLMIDRETMSPLLARDSFQETWTYPGGRQEEYKGFNLIFYEGITGMDRPAVLDSLVRNYGEGAVLARNNRPEPSPEFPADDSRENGGTGEESSGAAGTAREEEPKPAPPTPQELAAADKSLFEEDVTVYEREEGIALSLNNLHFVPDQAVILPQDYELLDRIAAMLKEVPDRTLLVKGYTADVGSMESQMVLSQERAKVVVDELTDRGIRADRFVYIGLGGSEPIGDNSTDEGRKLNRRVEIVIMED
ncbi:MAG: OmpA family protein [Spirochaetales bacterium]|nr:OmpA family protein [Spirochaetales bacterium]